MRFPVTILLLTLPLSCLAGEFRVPLMEKAPVIDGTIEAAEWGRAMGTSGLMWEGQLEQRRAFAYVGATTDTIYVGLTTQLPDEGELTTDVKMDSLKTVFDDSVEVWIDPTPGAESGRTYQLLFNSAGFKGWKLHARGTATEDVTWAGDWQIANGIHPEKGSTFDEGWHVEVAIPVKGLAPGRTTQDGAWGINVCRNWKNPWAFSSLGGGGYAPTDVFRFDPKAPMIRAGYKGDPATGRFFPMLFVHNVSQQPVSARAQVLLTRDVMPEIKQQETFEVPPGEYRDISLDIKDESTKKYSLALKATSPDGQTVYFDRTLAWKAAPAFVWKAVKVTPPPLDCQFAYYPYRNKLRLLVDISGMPKGSRADEVLATIRKRDGTVVKRVSFCGWETGIQRDEQTIALPELEGSYEIALTAKGDNVPAGETVKSFERTRYEWEHKKLGYSTKVYPPFTPLTVRGNKVGCVLREQEMNDVGLWSQCVATGKPLLAEPMRFVASIGGKNVAVQPGKLKFTQKGEQTVGAEASFTADKLIGRARCRWDYDGTMRMDLDLMKTQAAVDGLDLEIPLRGDVATHIHAMGDGIRNTIYQKIPEGEGVVWAADKVAVNDLPKGFCSYIYVGSPVRGLCWFAENDRGWGWDRKTPNLDLVRKNGQVILRVHLINQPTQITEPRTITFGLLAAPVKPRLEPWRHQWFRGKYTLLGTDINWFALGSCGSVYPAGKEMYFWEELKKANREQLSAEEISKVADYGRHYYEPYGADMVEMWNRHVQYNLRARYGQQMVFYYNRASYQLADEFQTFQDEWSLTDYRTVGPGNGIGEIKVVPSESYIDHALYWYGKSFDVADNRGVYWDNMFFVGDYNTAMSPAYTQADGSVMPSTGVWGLRELTKRTFQYMNERGMTPITMSHMTSTGILPMLSFCTVQYDWEWKYSEGDVQYRFPRDYILLVTNGELAGTWPVLLGDHGKLESDPWTQRTFAGVSYVHELTGGCYVKSLIEPILALLDHKDLQVYRYWDERPQPVQSGDADLPLIVYAVPGQEALVLVTSYREDDTEAALAVDAKALGFAGGWKAVDAESGAEVPLADGKIRFPLKKHDCRELRLVRR